jgi:FMN phosphatase YigB (HAD superfamily)
MKVNTSQITNTLTRKSHTQKVVLVDFDGVVLKNNTANKYISNKIETLVSKYTNVVDPGILNAFNKELYTGYGHTFLGLKKHGYMRSLKEFNDYVYGDTSEYKTIKMEEEEKVEWDDFLWACKQRGYQVKLFSNADKRWICNFMDYDEDLFSVQDLLESFDDPYASYMLKPEKYVYHLVTHKFFQQQVIMIDDKLVNFGNVLVEPNWWYAWYNNGRERNNDMTKLGGHTLTSNTNHRLAQCSSLYEAAVFINNI